MYVVIINCFDTYEDRVKLLKEYFANKGNIVKVYTADFRHFQKRKRDKAPEGFCLIKTKPYRKNLSVSRIISHMSFAKSVRKTLQKQISEIDLLWVMLPPNSLTKQISGLKHKYNDFKLVYDIIDMWPETMPFHGLKCLPPVKYWKNMRDKNLNYADLVVTECKLFREKVADCVSKNKLHNLYFAKKDVDVFMENMIDNDSLNMCYMGSINNIVDIEVIGKIIGQLKKQKVVKLHVIGDGEQRDSLLRTAEEAGAEVEYHGVIYDKGQKAKILSKCHFGLNIMKDSVFVGLTMKSMDYFAAGLPLINNIKGDTWEIVEKESLGVNYPFPTEALLEFSGKEETRRRIRRYFKDNFSGEAFVKRLDEIMEKV